MFGGMTEGSALYILRKGDKDNAPKLHVAYVTKRSDPVNANGTPAVNFGMPMDTFVNVEAHAGEETYKFDALKAKDTFRVYPEQNTVIADNPEPIIREVEAMSRVSQQVLETVPYHQSVVDSREAMMCMLNPQLAKEKEQEQKIGALESKIGGMETTLCNIQDMLAKALSGGGRKSNNS
jgi:hypothetical protein